jgi:hypothetical protein
VSANKGQHSKVQEHRHAWQDDANPILGKHHQLSSGGVSAGKPIREHERRQKKHGTKTRDTNCPECRDFEGVDYQGSN